MATQGRFGGIHNAQNSLEVENLARFAVNDYNTKNDALLIFKKVKSVKTQVVAGTLYYITMEVVDGGKTKVYEAKVLEQPWMNVQEVREFKLVGHA